MIRRTDDRSASRAPQPSRSYPHPVGTGGLRTFAAGAHLPATVVEAAIRPPRRCLASTSVGESESCPVPVQHG